MGSPENLEAPNRAETSSGSGSSNRQATSQEMGKTATKMTVTTGSK